MVPDQGKVIGCYTLTWEMVDAGEMVDTERQMASCEDETEAVMVLGSLDGTLNCVQGNKSSGGGREGGEYSLSSAGPSQLLLSSKSQSFQVLS